MGAYALVLRLCCKEGTESGGRGPVTLFGELGGK